MKNNQSIESAKICRPQKVTPQIIQTIDYETLYDLKIGGSSLSSLITTNLGVETIMGVVGAVAISAIGVNWSVHHPILAGAAVYVSWKGYKFVSKVSKIVYAVPRYFLKKIFPGNRSALSADDDEEVEDGIQAILDWATYDESKGDAVDVDIDIEDAVKKVASLESCVKIAKTFRDTLKGPIAILCEEIQKVKGNSINDEYPTIDEVNNVLKEYAQLTYLDNNYLTKAQIEEEYLNSEEISNKLDFINQVRFLNLFQ